MGDACMITDLDGFVELRQHSSNRCLESLGDPFDQAVFAPGVKVTQALQGIFVQHPSPGVCLGLVCGWLNPGVDRGVVRLCACCWCTVWRGQRVLADMRVFDQNLEQLALAEGFGQVVVKTQAEEAVFIAFQRYFLSGMTGGGVKG